MNPSRWLPWAAALPCLVLLLVYAGLGWLDPAYWLDEPPSVLTQATAPSGQAIKPTRPRAEARPPPPWPDEPAMRLLLIRRGLRLTGFQLGPQRMGATEVRVTLQWQGPLGASLELLQTLALDLPQMALDALVLQALPLGEWRVVWRGPWRQMAVPHPLPPRPRPIEGLATHGRASPFDSGLLQRELLRLWPLGQPSAALLRLVRPEDLQWVAAVRLPEPLAWLRWQQHILVVRVGDRIGGAGARVQAITSDQVVIVEAARTLRLRPATPASQPTASP